MPVFTYWFLTKANGYIYKTTLVPNAHEDCRGRDRKIARAKESEFVIRLHLLVIPDASSINYHQHDCLNINQARTNIISIKKYKQKILHDYNPRHHTHTHTHTPRNV